MISIGAWKPADGLNLEPNALLAAKELSRCLALTAGPGAGKTEMLAQRADFLFRTGTCFYPKRILAISFKVDASRNLKDRVKRRCNSDLAARFDSYTFHAFAKHIIDRFRPILKGELALDLGYKIVDRKLRPSRAEIEFSDLVPLAIEILQKSVLARNAVRQTYSDVFLDEFQDCTGLQYELIKIAFQGTSIRLIAVGDSKQKIMGWANALDGIFQSFIADFNAKPLQIYRNFRSKPRLLRLQNEIIRKLDPASVMHDEQLTGEEGEVFTWQFNDSLDEAKHLADLIERLIKNDLLPPAEIAVIISNQIHLYANHLMLELEARDIPFRNEQEMQDISTEPAARLIVDYLSCLFGSREAKAWIRLMNQLIVFDDQGIESSARSELDNLMKQQSKKTGSSKLGAEPFSDWWEFAASFLEKVSVKTLVALSPEYESPDRLREVIDKTKFRIEELLKQVCDLPKALEKFSEDQAVRILTIHKSKGLEFDTVIMMAVENESFFGNVEESRRAFFVGVSRAKKRLILTCARIRAKPSGSKSWKDNRSAQDEYFSYAAQLLSDES